MSDSGMDYRGSTPTRFRTVPLITPIFTLNHTVTLDHTTRAVHTLAVVTQVLITPLLTHSDVTRWYFHTSHTRYLVERKGDRAQTRYLHGIYL